MVLTGHDTVKIMTIIDMDVDGTAITAVICNVDLNLR